MTQGIVVERPSTAHEALADLLFHGGVVVITRTRGDDRGPWVRTSVLMDGDVFTTMSQGLTRESTASVVTTHVAELRKLTELVATRVSRGLQIAIDLSAAAAMAAAAVELVRLGLRPSLGILGSGALGVLLRGVLRALAGRRLRRSILALAPDRRRR